jgi:thiol-disulfide isomerase/thioredoxin/tetratricopeptide (TPR) repeat protein
MQVPFHRRDAESAEGSQRKPQENFKKVFFVPLCFLCVLCASAVIFAADTPPKPDEDEALGRALSEAGSSSVDFIRVLEQHLVKFPKSERRPEIERALLKASIDAKDDARIVKYGEPVLARETVELKTLEAVARALTATGDRAKAGRALECAQRYEKGVRDFEKNPPPGGVPLAKWREDIDRGYGRSFLIEARALEVLGRAAEALDLAQKSYSGYPSAEAAREIADLLAKSGKEEEAVRCYAEAFAIPGAPEADRAADRARMGGLYSKLRGSEAGLGDIVLQAYDRTAQVLHEREMRLRDVDPNARLTNPMEFTLTGLQGDKLVLSSLKGKVLVMDFWATWCGPCRVQHGLYEEVKARFKNMPEVVFLSINTDEERDLVPGFIAEHKWDKKVYFEDGLSSVLKIRSIPTSILINKRGEIESRMNGFDPDSFVEQLSERVGQALKQ